jgi:hypothetical protein
MQSIFSAQTSFTRHPGAACYGWKRVGLCGRCGAQAECQPLLIHCLPLMECLVVAAGWTFMPSEVGGTDLVTARHGRDVSPGTHQGE